MKQRKKNYSSAKKLTVGIIACAILFVSYMLFTTTLTGKATDKIINLEVEIPQEYNDIYPGQKLWFTTKILNLANEDRVDVTLTYDIHDAQRNTIITRSETVAIETHASFVGEIDIPEHTPEGNYMLIVTVTKADGEQRSSETSFHIQNQNSLQNTILQNIKLILTGAIIIILILIVMAYRKKMIAQIYKRKIKHKIKKMIKEKNS